MSYVILIRYLSDSLYLLESLDSEVLPACGSSVSTPNQKTSHNGNTLGTARTFGLGQFTIGTQHSIKGG